MVKLSELKKGDFFTLKEIDSPSEMQVYIKGDYDRSDKKYSCTCFGDICKEKFIQGNKLVFVDFTF